MPTSCVVGGCSRNSFKNSEVHFVQFPKDPAISKEWVKFVNNTRKDFTFSMFTTRSRPLICSAHFSVDCVEPSSALKKSLGLSTKFRLKPGSIPTLKASNIERNCVSTTTTDTRPAATSAESSASAGSAVAAESGAESQKGLLKREVGGFTGTAFQKRERSRNSNEANGHHTEEDAPLCSPGTINGQQPEVAQGEQFWKEYHQIKAEALLYRKACKTCKLLSLSNVKDDDRAFERYTGLPNYAVFEVLHDYMKPNSKWSGERTARDRLSNSAKRTLTSQEEFFMFLVTIKTGNLASDMALRFGITKPTFSVIFASWAVFVSNMLDDFSKTVMKPHASKFDELETIVVIDCTALLKRKTSSQPNENCLQKLKLLCVGISQDGVVTSVLGNLRDSASAEVVSSTSKNSDQVENSHFKVDIDQDEAAGKVLGEETPVEKTPAEETLAMLKDLEQVNAEKPLRAKMSHHVNITLNRIRQFRYLKQEVEPSNVDLYEQVFKACAYLTNFQLAS